MGLLRPRRDGGPVTGQWTASVSTYPTASRRRAGQVRRAHLIPPIGAFPNRGAPTAACGQPWWGTAKTGNEPVPLGGPLPAGITWCPKCLGVTADALGLAHRVAAMIAATAEQETGR